MNDSETYAKYIEEFLDAMIGILTEYGLSVLGAIAILILGWIASKWVARMVRKALERVPNADPMLVQFTSSAVRYAVLAFTVLAVLSQFGVETTSIIAVLGALGLAVGLALQGTLGHVASGIMLLIFRPFRIGDFVEAGGVSGTVKEINLFFTEMATLDNKEIIVPNGQIWGTTLTNYNVNPTRRVDIVIGIDYSDNIDTAFDAALEVVKTDDRVHTDPAPLVAVHSLGDNSVNILVRIWTNTSDWFAVQGALNKALKEKYDAVGLSIPFPQRTVHIVKSGA